MIRHFILRLSLWLVIPAGSMPAQQRLDDIGVQAGGKELVMPWTGGYNAPQFSNIDLNRDGIQDMISFDRQGDVLNTYMRLPATGRWILDRQYTPQFPRLADWVLIADYDGDGVEDLFTGASPAGIPGIAIYKGAVENDTWSFMPVYDRGASYLQVPAGPGLANLYVSWEDIPAITDVDGDGDLDVLAFEPNGSFITFFANQSVENGWGRDSLRFIVKDICWGKILENEFSEQVYLSENPNACSNGNITGEPPVVIRHAGSTVLALDVDFDGDKDAFIGDITSRRIVFLHNGLNAQQAWITEQDAHFPSGDVPVDIPNFIAAFSVQLDDDPEPELLAAVNSRTWAEDRTSVWRFDDDPFTDGPLIYQLDEQGFFQHEMLDFGSYSHPAVADINGDGLPDLIVGAHYYAQDGALRQPSLWLLENRGTATQPYFVPADDDFLDMAQYAAQIIYDFAPAFGDIDGNGTIDLLVGDNNGKLFFFKNKTLPGQPADYEPPVYPYMNIGVGASAAPQIADINGDGLGDLVIGERTGNSDANGRCSVFNYFENAGSPGNAVFLPDPAVAPNTQCFGRVLFDIIIGLPQFGAPSIVPTDEGLVMLTGNDPGKLLLFTGLQAGKTGPFTLLDGSYGQIDAGTRSRPCLADVNADGYYEMIVGNQRGGLELWATGLRAGTTSVATPGDETEKPYFLSGNNGNGFADLRLNEGVRASLSLYDMAGRALMPVTEVYDTFYRVDLSSGPPGIYLLQIRAGGRVWIEKVVKVTHQ